MTKRYTPPVLVEHGPVGLITAALGSESRPDFSVFPQIPASTGSVDICPHVTPDRC